MGLLDSQTKCSGKVMFKSCRCVLSHVRPFVTPRSVVHQAPLSIAISQARILECVPFPSPGDLPDLGIKPISPVLAGRFFITEPSGNPCRQILPMWIYLEKLQICMVRPPKMAILLLSVHPHLTRAHSPICYTDDWPWYILAPSPSYWLFFFIINFYWSIMLC